MWVDAWQLQCCGDPFSVGGRVAWTLRDLPAGGAYADVAGRETAARLTQAEEHHGGVPEDAAPVHGTVRGITAVHGRFGGDQRWAPGERVRVSEADGSDAVEGLLLSGYVVDLDADEPRPG